MRCPLAALLASLLAVGSCYPMGKMTDEMETLLLNDEALSLRRDIRDEDIEALDGIKERSDISCVGRYILGQQALPWGDDEYIQPIYVEIDYLVAESQFELTVTYLERTKWRAARSSKCNGGFQILTPYIEPLSSEVLYDTQSVFLRSLISGLQALFPSTQADVLEMVCAAQADKLYLYYVTSNDDWDDEEEDYEGADWGSVGQAEPFARFALPSTTEASPSDNDDYMNHSSMNQSSMNPEVSYLV